MGKRESRSTSITAEVVESVTYAGLLNAIGELLRKARSDIARHVNHVLVQTYWQTGRYIVEYEQKGRDRAKYGEGLIDRLVRDLTAREGRGYSKTNILYMRKFYLTFRKGETLSHFLSWSHYMLILKKAEGLEIEFYCAGSWRWRWTRRRDDLALRRSRFTARRKARRRNERSHF